MKKLLAALLAVASLALVSDAGAWGGCRSRCAAAPVCPEVVTEAPVPVCEKTVCHVERECPTKYVDITYACPAGTTSANGNMVTHKSGKRARNM